MGHVLGRRTRPDQCARNYHGRNSDVARVSTRGWEGVTASQLKSAGQAKVAKPSKYRNVKVTIDGQRFDSKREAEYWLLLKERERRGEITGLKRQIPFALYAPDDRVTSARMKVQIAEYVADYVYDEAGVEHVVDAKARRICPYPLKKKWLELQSGIRIEEV